MWVGSGKHHRPGARRKTQKALLRAEAAKAIVARVSWLKDMYEAIDRILKTLYVTAKLHTNSPIIIDSEDSGNPEAEMSMAMPAAGNGAGEEVHLQGGEHVRVGQGQRRR